MRLMGRDESAFEIENATAWVESPDWSARSRSTLTWISSVPLSSELSTSRAHDVPSRVLTTRSATSSSTAMSSPMRSMLIPKLPPP